MISFDTFHSLGRDSVEATLRSFGAVSTATQTVAVETADYAKRSFEQNTQAAERLLGARTPEAVLQIGGEYVRASYQGAVAQVTKMGELAVDVARNVAAPIEGLFAKSSQTA